MSLYAMEEICDGCLNAVFHECCRSFCNCKAQRKVIISNRDGSCSHRKRKCETCGEIFRHMGVYELECIKCRGE